VQEEHLDSDELEDARLRIALIVSGAEAFGLRPRVAFIGITADGRAAIEMEFTLDAQLKAPD
jgi:hypothetical protein